jgi:hypothetical protein
MVKGKGKEADSDGMVVMPDFTSHEATGVLRLVGGSISRDDEQDDDEVYLTVKAEVRTLEDTVLQDVVLPRCFDNDKVRAMLRTGLAGGGKGDISEPLPMLLGRLHIQRILDGEATEGVVFTGARLEQQKLECAEGGKARILYKWKVATDPYTVGLTTAMLAREVRVTYTLDAPNLPLKKARSLAEGEA